MIRNRSTARGRVGRVLLAVATMTAGLGAAVGVAIPQSAAAGAQAIVNNTAAKTVTMTGSDYSLVYDYNGKSVVTSFTLGGTQLLNAGMYSAVQLAVDGSSFDSRTLAADPTVSVNGSQLTASFTMGNSSLSVAEQWHFVVTPDNVHVQVERTYHWLETANTEIQHNGMLTIGWARVWDNIRRPQDGGDLPIGNAYTGTNNFFLSQPNDRYGVEESKFVMLKNSTQQALDVSASSNRSLATEFAYTGDGTTYQETQVSSAVSWNYTAGTLQNGLVYGGHSSNGTTNFIYAPVTMTQGQQDEVDFLFAADNYAKYYSLGGTINGIDDPGALSSMLNDFGRSGVIDKDYGMSTVGLRFPGVGPYDMVYAERTVLGYYDPAMTASQERLLEYFRDFAQQSSGHMDGRTFHLNTTWGTNTLWDADPSYAMAVADTYQYSGDQSWLTSMRASAEKALAFMINNQYSSTDGLFVNDVNNCTSQKGAREWNDGFFVKWESGYVNELMYRALTQWSTLEQTVFNDSELAMSYASLAVKLKDQFNKDNTAGGLWDPATGMFDYWRCPDGTVQGKVQDTQINLQAISFGMVDLDRARQILDGIDRNMQLNHLKLIPQNFQPLAPNTEDTSGDHFGNGIEDGSIYPLMTEEYMRAAAMVGERDRSLTYLNNTVARYTRDGFNGWSFLDWFLNPRPGEAWFPANANGAAGLFSDVLGIQPTAAGVTIAPNIPASMNGTTVTKTIHSNDSVSITYHNELSETVNFSSSTEPVTLQWSGQTPSSSYTVTDNGTSATVTADSMGIVRYTYTGSGTHTITLQQGSAAGYVLPQVPADLAFGKPVIASSSWEVSDNDDGFWSTADAVDGIPYGVDGSFGWSSNSDLTENHTESITVDLGSSQTVGDVTLWPRDRDAKPTDIARDFPIDFNIAVSNDGTTWTTVASETAYPQPTDGVARALSFTPVQARYVRMQGTNLRHDDNSQYRMQFAEVQVFSTTSPPVAPVVLSTSA